jgi:nucleoid-associated protein YgaU
MLTAPLKIGIAVACLVGIAAIIAVDQVRLQRRESMTITTVAAPTVQTALPAVVAPVAAPAPTPVVAPAAAEPVICPAPAAEASAKPAAVPPVKEAAPVVYTVQQGDSLYGISTKVFGTPRHYERIYEANRDRIKDPNTLQVGINLKMPEVQKTAAQ